MERSEKTAEEIEVFSVEQEGLVRMRRLVLSDAEWRKRLAPESFRILRQQGTERAFSGRYWDDKRDGVYRCAGCGNDLFLSQTKFESGTGWPSFYRAVSDANIATREDRGFFMRRTEVVCSRCDGHLGHVFPDGPPPTGQRYCLNSAALDFVPE